MATLLGSLALVLVGYSVRKFQALESEARADPSLDVVLATRVLSLPEQRLALELRVEVKNNSRIAWALPAVYASVRPLVPHGGIAHLEGTSDFEALETLGSLSEPRNLARLERSIIQLMPDETESFVRWDLISEELLVKSPVLIANVEVFGASQDLLGLQRRPPFRKGRLRESWLKYMNSDGGVRHRFIVFDRFSVVEVSDVALSPLKGAIAQLFTRLTSTSARYIGDGERCLRLPNYSVGAAAAPGGFDETNTRVFWRLLQTVAQWTRHATVDLRTGYAVNDGEPSGLNDGRD